MLIERSGLIDALLGFARQGHGLVVGQPGVGKSYSLARLGGALADQGVPHLALAVEELGDASEDALRAQLGYVGTFTDQLQLLFASSPAGGVLIVDGFDAARNAEVRARLIDLINRIVRQCPAGWTILVSVRNYDAARSPSLLALFPPTHEGDGTGDYRSPSIRARHFLIPELTATEVSEAVAGLSAPFDLQALLKERLGRLLRTPFNLWLLERVLDIGTDAAELTQLGSELQLLRLFWTKLVALASDADAKLLVLRRVVERMVERGRLDVPKADVFSPDLHGPWESLLSVEVLTELGTARESIAFKHNLLFDFAVATLAVGPATGGLADFIAADPSRPLFLRPSLLYFFSLQWHEAREEFWKAFWELLDSPSLPVRLVARLLPPVVLASESRDVGDLRPLLERAALNNAGRQAVLRVLQGLQFTEPHDSHLWLEFARSLADIPDRVFAWELGRLLSRLRETQWADLLEADRTSIGEGAGRLLDWVWTERDSDKSGWLDAFGAIVVLPLVLETMDQRVDAATEQVRRVFDLLGQPNFPIRYFYALADGIEHVIKVAPSLAAETYRLIFSHNEESRTPTHMGGIVVSLTSDRRQDFHMCHYALARAFPGFLERSPLVAAPVAFDALNAFIIRDRLAPFVREGHQLGEMVEGFAFHGKSCGLLPDLGAIWGAHQHDEEVQLADHLVAFASGDSFTDDPELLINSLADHAFTGSTWATLLRLGAASPSRFAGPLFDVVLASPIQHSGDLYHDLRAFVHAAYPYWSVAQRQQFERSWPASQLDHPSVEVGRRRVDSLVQGLPSELVALDETRKLAQEVRNGTEGGQPEGVGMSASIQTYSQNDWLREQGIDPDGPQNAALRASHDELGEFTEGADTPLSSERVHALLPIVSRAIDVLGAAGDADEAVRSLLWTRLAAAAAKIAQTEPATTTEAYGRVRGVLLAAADRPANWSGSDADYSWPHWAPSPRTGAIEGIAYLLRVAADEHLESRMRDLSASPDPAERFLVARYLRVLTLRRPEFYWELATKSADTESNAVAATATLESLAAVGSAQEILREPLVVRLIERLHGNSQRDLTRIIAGWLQYYALFLDREWAWTRMRGALNCVPATKDLLGDVNFEVVNWIEPKRLRRDSDRDGVERARGWLVEVIRELALRAARVRTQVAQSQPEANDSLQAIHVLVGNIIDRIYFNLRRGEESLGRPTLPELKMTAAYYEAVTPILDAIVAFGRDDAAGTVVPAAAHHLMQFFNVVVSIDPAGVLSQAAAICAAGSKSGYHLDSLAIDEVVRLVETILTDHREVVTQGKPLDDLLRLLDLFADAGWPQALRLVWRLDEVFR